MGIIVCFSVIMKAVVLVLTVSPLVWGHGGMLWPSTWQDAQHQTLETINSSTMGSDPALRDPITGDKIERNTDNVMATGMGVDLCLPVMRNAKATLLQCVRLAYLRDCRSWPKYHLANIDVNGSTIEGPLMIDSDWEFAKGVKGYE